MAFLSFERHGPLRHQAIRRFSHDVWPTAPPSALFSSMREAKSGTTVTAISNENASATTTVNATSANKRRTSALTNTNGRKMTIKMSVDEATATAISLVASTTKA